MKYEATVTLQDGTPLLLRSGRREDAPAVLALFAKARQETDFLLSTSHESSMDEESEALFIKAMEENPRAAEVLAFLDGTLVGCVGVHAVGEKEKIRHRADFGIVVLRAYWGRGVGGALLSACIALAEKAGYTQLELDVVKDNVRALALYSRAGFTQYAENPRGFQINGSYAPLLSMYLPL